VHWKQRPYSFLRLHALELRRTCVLQHVLCGSPWNRCSTWCTPTRNPSKFKSGNAEIERAEWCNTWTKPPTDHHAPLQPGQDTSLVSTEEQQDPSLQISGLATCTLTCQACGLTCMDYMGLSIFLCSLQFWIFADLAAPPAPL